MNYLYDLINKNKFLAICEKEIECCYHMIISAYKNGNKLLLCGNGGSAADAEHITGELMKGFLCKRTIDEKKKEKIKHTSPENGEMISKYLQTPLPAISLSSQMSLITAIINDIHPDMVFAQQVYGYGKKGDILIGISTSGNSKNVIYAMETAKALDMKVIAFTGKTGGKLSHLWDAGICVPSDYTSEIQEYHLKIYHALCAQIEQYFFLK